LHLYDNSALTRIHTVQLYSINMILEEIPTIGNDPDMMSITAQWKNSNRNIHSRPVPSCVHKLIILM
jgi:hypothetical protein